MGYVAVLDDDGGMVTSPREMWDGLIRQHDRKVVLSLIALGIDRDRARDLAQATWTRLYEQHQDGKLAALELPGLAIRQARFLAIDSFRHTELQRRTLAMTRVEVSEDGEQQLLTRDQLRRALEALGTCSPMAQQLFRLLYTPPPRTSADAAREVGLSAERARHVVCEARKLIRQAIGDER